MCLFFFFNDTATTEIYTLSLHDALPICDDRNIELPQQLRVADARELEQLRRVDRTGRQQHLQARARLLPLTGAQVLHPYRARARKQHPRGVRAQAHLEIGAPPHRPQVRIGARDAHAILDGDVPQARAFGLRTVEVAGGCDADAGARLEEARTQGVHARRHVAHVHRTSGAVEFGSAPRVILELPEVGEQLAPGPAGIARRAPVVEVRRLPAHVHHGVDGARPAQYLTARPEGAAAVR